ncbi:Dabb family protein [Microbacterium schleiferi]|uniref:Dabb family protein n=1 Tax=Microbacterium schleiferi TaxID=69362 RepID=UPI001D179781|nr:Dabb family protein [Microbacterium schleiferi]MCC4266757.1 Dabb family protein [Microbacterium schleiferi]
MFRHIVLFRVHDDASDAELEQAVSALRGLGDEAEAVSWNVEVSLDSRKGRVIVEDTTFADAAAFDRFRAHPAHIAIADQMARISDWWVGEYHTRDN